MNQFIFEPLVFILFVASCLFLPGKYFLSKLKLDTSPLEDIFLSTALGIILFTLVAYVLSWIKLEILILPIFIVLDALAIRNKYYFPLKPSKIHMLPLSFVGIMSLIFSLKMLITGQYGSSILIRHDDPWHLALINELKVHFPPFNPSFAEIPLKGYHFFYDFFASLISNIFFISPLSLHFHLIPLFTALMWGLGVYALMFKWTKKTSAGLWAVFLTMFGGSFSFIFYLFGNKTIDLDGGLGIGTPIWSLYNPPLSMSLIIIIAILFMIYNFLQDKRKAWLFLLALCIGMISMFKVYAGIIMFGAFIVFALQQLRSKNYKIFLSLILAALVFLGTYWLFAGGSGSLIFFPLWGPERLLQSFTWFNYDNKIYVYTNYVVSHSHFFHGLIGLAYTYTTGLVLFIFGSLGTRLLGFLCLVFLLTPKKRKLPSFFSFLLFVMLLISIVIPLFFIQTGKVFEIIQMGQYYLFFCSLFAGLGFATFFALKFNKYIKGLILGILLISTVPHMYGTFSSYLQEVQAFRSMNSPYFQTMHYLSTIGKYDDTVLELPPNDVLPTAKSIREWYYYSSNASLTALANKRTYFDNEFIDFPNLDLRERLNYMEDVMQLIANDITSSSYPNMDNQLLGLLKDGKIKYIYVPYESPFLNKSRNLKRIYQKGNYILYVVNGR